MADMPHGLPYIDHPDEPNFYALANDVRGVRDAYWRNDWLHGYPPGYIWLYGVILNGVDALAENNIHTDMGMYVGTLRIVSILFDMLTLALIIVATRWLAGSFASVLAGGVWAVSAAVVQNAILALPDPPTVFACVLCVVWVLKAFRHESFLWAILATLAGLLATVFKYPVAPILLLPAAFCVWQLQHNFRRAFLPSVLALALVLLTAYELFFVYGANTLSNVEANTVRSSFLSNLLDPLRWYKVFNGLFGTFGIGLLAVLALAVFWAIKEKNSPYAPANPLICSSILKIIPPSPSSRSQVSPAF
jgi:4-amino-4-deoxy-L-arabinose transferase-like glycosyltransferase